MKLVEAEIIKFFIELMETRAGRLPWPNTELIKARPWLFYSQKCRLMNEITVEKIVQVIKGLPTDKTPGVDGFPAEFI